MRTQFTALLAVGACSLAACGGDDGTPAADAERPAGSTRQAMADFAQCMRENGVDIPDPGAADEQGPVEISGNPEELREAEEACAELRDKIPAPDLTDEQKEELKDAALAHSRCMREQGIDVPDPQFDAEGGAMVQIGPGSGIDFDDPDFRKAQEACRDTLPEIRLGDAP